MIPFHLTAMSSVSGTAVHSPEPDFGHPGGFPAAVTRQPYRTRHCGLLFNGRPGAYFAEENIMQLHPHARWEGFGFSFFLERY
jgi:hypothetical protein